MSYSYNKSFEGAYRLDLENIERFMDIIRQVCGTQARARISFDDDVNITYDDNGIPVKEKARYSRVERIALSSVETWPKNRFEVKFRQTADSGEVSVELAGDIEHCERYKGDILAEIRRMRCSYDWFYKSVNPFRRAFVVFVQFSALSALYFVFLAYTINAFHPSEAAMARIGYVFLPMMVILSMGTMFYINKLAFRYYSPMIFDFGKGSEDQKNVEKRRTTFWALIASPVIVAIATPPVIGWLYSGSAPAAPSQSVAAPHKPDGASDPATTAPATPSPHQ